MSLPQGHAFRRRHYRRSAELWGDLRRLAALRGAARLSRAMTERLMLVVRVRIDTLRFLKTLR